MKTQKQIYAIVRYPKTCKGANQFSLNVYSKQTSNLDKLIEYYNQLRITYNSNDYNLVIVKRETAKQMNRLWHRYMRAR